MNIRQINEELEKYLPKKRIAESEDIYTVKYQISNVDWLVEAEDFDDEKTEEEIEEFKKTIPTEFEVELELAEDEVEDILDWMKEDGKSFEEELDSYLEAGGYEALSDLVSDETGWLCNDFDSKIIGYSDALKKLI